MYACVFVWTGTKLQKVKALETNAGAHQKLNWLKKHATQTLGRYFWASCQWSRKKRVASGVHNVGFRVAERERFNMLVLVDNSYDQEMFNPKLTSAWRKVDMLCLVLERQLWN